MRRKYLILLVTLLALPWGLASAQRTYKWIDERGNISYRDHPPPPGSGYRVEERRIDSRAVRSDDAAAPAQGAPVVLYSVPSCSPCDTAREHLKKRNIPFSEKNVHNDYKLQQELKQKAGGLTVPTITVGAKVLNTYAAGWLDSELDQAGYAKTGGAEPDAGAQTDATEESTEEPASESRDLAPAR